MRQQRAKKRDLVQATLQEHEAVRKKGWQYKPAEVVEFVDCDSASRESAGSGAVCWCPQHGVSCTMHVDGKDDDAQVSKDDGVEDDADGGPAHGAAEAVVQDGEFGAEEEGEDAGASDEDDAALDVQLDSSAVSRCLV